MIFNKESNQLISNNRALSSTIILSLVIAPLFLVTVNGWISAILFVSALLSVIYLIQQGVLEEKNGLRDLKWLSLALMLPVTALLFSALFREKFELRLFDSPSRFLIAIPILWFIVREKFNTAKYLQYTLPCSLIITIIQQYTFHQPFHWGMGRMSTYFVDPLTFGQYALTFGLICLVSINLFGKDSPALLLLKTLGVTLGLYLSIKSGSRTGWLAAPIVISFYMLQRNKQIQIWHICSTIALVLVLLAASYFLSPIIHNRTDLALHEALTYNWIGVAPNTSVGMRITFFRIAINLFMQRPWAGFGDHGIQNYLNNPEFTRFATEYARQFVLHSGFHNELITNAIRSGIGGVIATLAIFIVPFIIFCKAFRSDSPIRSANGLLGLTFVICQVVSGLSTEVINLKFTASFYALLIVCLCGSSMIHHEKR